MAPRMIFWFSLRLGLIGLWLTLGPGCSSDELPDSSPKPPKVVQSIETGSEKATPIEKEDSLKKVMLKVEGEKIQDSQAKQEEELDPLKQAGVKSERRESNFYKVQPGDNLTLIAARDDVYGDPLKWPILYRHNYERLRYLAGSDNLIHRQLTPDLKLSLLTEQERQRNLEKRQDQLWVVNILSSTSEEEITQRTASLIEKGYPVYITTALIDGTRWQRLRIGFFKSRNEADEIGRDIMSKLKLADSWTTKIGEVEFEEFAGY